MEKQQWLHTLSPLRFPEIPEAVPKEGKQPSTRASLGSVYPIHHRHQQEYRRGNLITIDVLSAGGGAYQALDEAGEGEGMMRRLAREEEEAAAAAERHAEVGGDPGAKVAGKGHSFAGNEWQGVAGFHTAGDGPEGTLEVRLPRLSPMSSVVFCCVP